MTSARGIVLEAAVSVGLMIYGASESTAPALTKPQPANSAQVRVSTIGCISKSNAERVLLDGPRSDVIAGKIIGIEWNCFEVKKGTSGDLIKTEGNLVLLHEALKPGRHPADRFRPYYIPASAVWSEGK